MESDNLTQLINSNKEELSFQQQQDIDKIYHHLKKIAKSQKFKIQNSGLNTTSIVNEAWLKSFNKNKSFNDRNHFFAYCAIAMRHILIEQARKNKLLTSIEDKSTVENQPINKQSDYLLELDRQLIRLKSFSERLEQVFTYRFFSEMEFDAIATIMDVSERTIIRDWKKARTMLAVAMKYE
jgi:RNA polymerase sigma factor (TIGR02999 family)